MIRPTFAVAGVVLLAATCTQPDGSPPQVPADTVSSAADVEAIEQLREREVAAFMGGDVDALVAVITEDAVIMPPGAPALSGREEVRSWFQGMIEQLEFSGEYTGGDIVVAGDRAIERYTANLAASPVGGPEAEAEPMKGIHVYERQPDGTWRIAMDIWNANAPAEGSDGP